MGNAGNYQKAPADIQSTQFAATHLGPRLRLTAGARRYARYEKN